MGDGRHRRRDRTAARRSRRVGAPRQPSHVDGSLLAGTDTDHAGALRRSPASGEGHRRTRRRRRRRRADGRAVGRHLDRRNRSRAEGEALLAQGLAHPLGALLEPIAIAFQAFYVDWHAGRLDAALAGAEQAIARLEEFDPARWLPYTLWYAAYVQEARGEDAAAVGAARAIARATRRYGLGAYPAAVATAIKACCDARAGRSPKRRRAGPGRAASERDVAWLRRRARARGVGGTPGRPGRRLAAAERARAGRARLRSGSICAGRRCWPRCWPAPAPRRRRAPSSTRPCRVPAARERAAAAGAARMAARSLGDAERRTTSSWPGRRRATSCATCCGASGRGSSASSGRPSQARRLDSEAVVVALADAFPQVDVVLGLLDHADPRVRAAAADSSSAPPAIRWPPNGSPASAATPTPASPRQRGAVPWRCATSRAPLVFTLFGAFAVRRGGREVDEHEWQRRVAARVVRYLLLHRDSAVAEDLLFEAFWPEANAASARRSLQVAISAARAVLDPPAPRAADRGARALLPAGPAAQ